MVRPPSFDRHGIKSGVWSKEEDDKLRAFILKHGHHNWQKLPFSAGLARSGKSCRLRWVNYLQPGLKKGNFSKEEVDLIIKMHNQIGNKWSAIAEKFPGRTDNDIKNHWHAHINKRCRFVSKAEMGHEEEFDINCKKSKVEEESPALNDIVFAQDENSINIEALWDEAYDRTIFPEEVFNDFNLCYNYNPTSGISYEKLNIDIPSSITDEELSTLGICYNDTPTFSDSSQSEITYDDQTYFSQFNIDIDILSFSEVEFSDYGLCHNDTPGGITSSESILKIQREVFAFNPFGEDMVLW